MKVVIAIDSFKGSVSSIKAGTAAATGVKRAIANADIIVKPLADGGEGSTDALIEGLEGERIFIEATGPLGKKVTSCYGFLPKTKTAILEMAATAGITLLSPDEKNPMEATTYGVGEVICAAIQRGARDFIIGIGGSATNDGGIGMLKALGYQFLDKDGKEVPEGAKALGQVAKILDAHVLPEVKDCQFNIACDVNNPLCGNKGATYIYGPQKGVTEEMKASLDKDMAHYAKVCAAYAKKDYTDYPGSGAAGGLGFAFITFLPAKLQPGIDLILEAVGLEHDLQDADYVITGEGCLDQQTAMGKAPLGVARLAKKHGATVIALAGAASQDARACNAAGIDGFFCIQTKAISLEEAMEKETAAENIALTAEQVFRVIKCVAAN